MTTVLIVEDEANVRKLVAVNLVSRGYSVLEARDVQQAWLHLQHTVPDLIVLDIKLPDGTGWDLLTGQAGQPPLRPTVPVLVMTASIMDSYVDNSNRKNPPTRQICGICSERLQPIVVPVL